jgi:6-phosphogluconolactonase (cycloisomerase 2 family)
MKSSLLMLLGSLVGSALATNLYVSSYAETITSLELGRKSDGKYSLVQTSVNDGSKPNPSWLTKDKYNNVIYCVDEQFSGSNGSLASYRTSSSGNLTQIDRQSVIPGPVHSAVYNGGKALALAH